MISENMFFQNRNKKEKVSTTVHLTGRLFVFCRGSRTGFASLRAVPTLFTTWSSVSADCEDCYRPELNPTINRHLCRICDIINQDDVNAGDECPRVSSLLSSSSCKSTPAETVPPPHPPSSELVISKLVFLSHFLQTIISLCLHRSRVHLHSCGSCRPASGPSVWLRVHVRASKRSLTNRRQVATPSLSDPSQKENWEGNACPWYESHHQALLIKSMFTPLLQTLSINSNVPVITHQNISVESSGSYSTYFLFHWLSWNPPTAKRLQKDKQLLNKLCWFFHENNNKKGRSR